MNLNSLFVKTVRTRLQLYNYQTVRWRRPRKPFWLGIAKSKMFKIPQPKVIFTPEENLKNISLDRQYRTEMKSLMHFIKHDNPKLKEMIFETVEGEGTKRSPALEQLISESLKNNEKWNAESARRRDERLKKDMAKHMEKAIKEINAHEEARIKQMEILEEIVRKEKDLSEFYVTPENLDEAIERCLNKIDCFDFAIDLDGKKYEGRDPLPSRQRKNIKDMPIETFFEPQ